MLMAQNLLLMRRRYRTSVSDAALFLATHGPYGMVLDFADASIAIKEASGVLDFTSQGQISNGALIGPGAKTTYSAPSPKLTEQSDGVIRFQAHNLALWSEDFSNAAWVNTAAGVTRTLEAGMYKITCPSNPNAGGLYQSFTYVNGAGYTFSMELKAGTYSYVALDFANAANRGATFDLSDGSIGFTDSDITSSIEALGNGVYRCTIQSASLALGASFPEFYASSSRTANGRAWTPPAGTTYFVNKAHLRRTPSQSDYIATTSTPAYDLPYVYSGGELQGIMVEPAATNLALWSSHLEITHALTVTGGSGTFADGETVSASGGGTGVYQSSTSTSTIFTLRTGSGTFTGTLTGGTSGATRTISSAAIIWTPSNITTASTATGPDGVANSASTLTATAANATALQAITSASSSRLTSVYIKRRTGSGNIDLTQDNGTTWTTQTVTSSWTRVALAAVTSTNPTVGIRIATSGDAVDVWCFQHETGTVATSPIITYGAAVARVADSPLALLNLFPSIGTAYTIYAKYKPQSASVATTALQLDDTTANELVRLDNKASGQGRLTVVDGGVTQAALESSVVSSTAFNRLAASIEANNVRIVVNGGAAVQDTSVTLPTLTRLLLGGAGGMELAQLAILPGARTEAQLQALGA